MFYIILGLCLLYQARRYAAHHALSPYPVITIRTISEPFQIFSVVINHSQLKTIARKKWNKANSLTLCLLVQSISIWGKKLFALCMYFSPLNIILFTIKFHFKFLKLWYTGDNWNHLNVGVPSKTSYFNAIIMRSFLLVNTILYFAIYQSCIFSTKSILGHLLCSSDKQNGFLKVISI